MSKRFLCALLCAALCLTAAAGLAEEIQYGYCNADTTVFVNASEKALSQGPAAKGTRVTVEDEIKDETADFTWYQVTVEDGGVKGYIRSADVDLVIPKKPWSGKSVNTAQPAGAVIVKDAEAYPVLKASGKVETPPPDPSQYREIQIGDTGEDVQALKNRLAELGYLSAAGNNKMVKAVTAAIKDFQKANGLKQDGLCTPELQSSLFASTAKPKKAKAVTDPLQFSKGSVKTNKNGGGIIVCTIKNTTKEEIDAFDYRIRLYNTYGERFLLHSLSAEVTIQKEFQALDTTEERDSLKKGASATMNLDMGSLYFAGCKIAILGYHTVSGQTVRYQDDQLHWFGLGKGVEAGYAETEVTALTPEEEEQAKAWGLGVTGLYVDEEMAKEYGVMAGCLITGMDPGCPMDQAGVQNGDVLLAVGDVRIFGGASLIRAAARIKAGDSVTVLFFRNGNIYASTLNRPGEWGDI